VPDSARVTRVLELLDLPPEKRPSFLTLYLSPVDGAGHDFGPDSKEVNQAIVKVDSTLGRLIAGLDQRGLANAVNLVIVSDHGMAALSPERVIRLDDYIDQTAVKIDEFSPILTAWPGPGLADSVYNGLRRAPHLTTFRRGQLPSRWHLEGSPRTPPIVAIADEGWTIAWRDTTGTKRWTEKGNHGYDNSLPVMRAIFIAHGPAFRQGVSVPAFSNIHIYPLMAEVLGLDPADNDGSLDSVRAMLAHCDSRRCEAH
jgi:predicted AlkP superfamily pyrophosphatase or phosphodiesterase